MAADTSGHAIDIIPHAEVRHAFAHGRDRTGKVEAEDRWQGVPRVLGHSGPDLGIERVYPARTDPDEEFAGRRLRPRHLNGSERPVLALHDRRPHRRPMRQCSASIDDVDAGVTDNQCPAAL
jgi:hypothetical protein